MTTLDPIHFGEYRYERSQSCGLYKQMSAGRLRFAANIVSAFIVFLDVVVFSALVGAVVYVFL